MCIYICVYIYIYIYIYIYKYTHNGDGTPKEYHSKYSTLY